MVGMESFDEMMCSIRSSRVLSELYVTRVVVQEQGANWKTKKYKSGRLRVTIGKAN